MEHKLINFPNKFKAVICNKDCRMVAVSLSICIGAELEPKGKSGISHLIERLIRSNLSASVSEFGGIIETKTDFEHIEFNVSCQSSALEKCLKALSECIFDFFPKQASLDREIFKITQEIEKESFNPTALLNNLTQKYIYKGTNLSTTVLGNAKTLQTITLEDVRAFLHDCLLPENVLLSIVGELTLQKNENGENLTTAEAFDKVQSFINQYFYIRIMEKNGRRRPRSTPPVALQSPVFISKNKPLNQTRFQISFPTAPHESAGYKYSKIFEMYLNLYLRMELKMVSGVYGVDVVVRQFKNNSHISITFAVDSAVAEDVYHCVVKSLKKLKSEQITRQEFNIMLDKYKTEVALQHTTPQTIAVRYNKMLFLKDELFNLDNELQQISSLSYDNFNITCVKTLDFNSVLVVAIGKIDKEFNPFLEIGG